MESNIVDLQPLVEMFFQFLAAILAAVLTWAGVKARGWIGLQTDELNRARMQDALERAVDFGVEKLKGAVAGRAKFAIKNELVAVAANYVGANLPDTVAYFKITPESLAEMVSARLGGNVAATALIESGTDEKPVDAGGNR